jgi:hypothetical protein
MAIDKSAAYPASHYQQRKSTQIEQQRQAVRRQWLQAIGKCTIAGCSG